MSLNDNELRKKWNMMSVQSFKFEVKQLTPEGESSGLASVFGNLDLGGDIVEAGAFQRTLAHRGGGSDLVPAQSAGFVSAVQAKPVSMACFLLKRLRDSAA